MYKLPHQECIKQRRGTKSCLDSLTKYRYFGRHHPITSEVEVD